MDNSIFLFAAFSLSWTIIFVYVFRLYQIQKAMVNQIDKIKNKLANKTGHYGRQVTPHED